MIEWTPKQLRELANSSAKVTSPTVRKALESAAREIERLTANTKAAANVIEYLGENASDKRTAP